jgi:hypothetical protein
MDISLTSHIMLLNSLSQQILFTCGQRHHHMKQEAYYPHKLTGDALAIGYMYKNSMSVHTHFPH